MTPAQHAFLDDLSGTLGPSAVVTDPELIAPWCVDWRKRYFGAAPALVQPGTTAGVATAVTLATQHGVALVPQGGNTSMVGGATPPADGSALILSLRRMARIRSIDAGAGLAVAEAGVILAELHAAAAKVGQRFPLTLGARGSATIGGLVSTNAGGTQVLRWGTMRGLVAGIEAVLPDGSVHDGLVPLKKDNRGYDLTQLLVGAEGTLGVVTAATLRLTPAVRERAVGWAGAASPQAALALLRRLETTSDAIEGCELIAGDVAERAFAHLGVQAPIAGQHEWHVLVEAVASAPDDAAPAVILEQGLAAAHADRLIGDATIAASEAQAEAFWRIRDSLSDSERAHGPAAQHDISVPVEAMPDFLLSTSVAVEAAFPGTRATGFGHLGDGNIHYHVRAPAGADPARWHADAAPAITRFVHDAVVAAGGSISAEHGIGQMKLGELARLSAPARLHALRAIKAALDPAGLLNPGKLVPLARADVVP